MFGLRRRVCRALCFKYRKPIGIHSRLHNAKVEAFKANYGHSNTVLCLVLVFFLGCANVFARVEDKEPVAVVELGGAAGWNLNESFTLSPTTAIEVTPIEKWLELEMGVTPAFGHHLTE